MDDTALMIRLLKRLKVEMNGAVTGAMQERGIVYPLNYGYIPGVLGGDGEELDVYLIDVNEPVERFTGRIIGIAHRENDIEDKLIMAPPDKKFTRDEVERAVHFQEQYYNTQIELIE